MQEVFSAGGPLSSWEQVSLLVLALVILVPVPVPVLVFMFVFVFVRRDYYGLVDDNRGWTHDNRWGEPHDNRLANDYHRFAANDAAGGYAGKQAERHSDKNLDHGRIPRRCSARIVSASPFESHDSLQVDLSAADAAFVGAVDTALLFKERAAKGGIDVNVVRVPDDGYWTDVWLKRPFVMCFWGGRPTEDWMFSQVYAKNAPWNDTHWDQERFNKLLAEARPELDESKRRELYREMQLILRDEGGVIVPMYANYVFARSTKVARGDAIAANWELDGWKCIERWWFA
jgi:hypothetical protein